MRNKVFPLFLIFLISISSCKKDAVEKEQPVSPTTGTRMEFTLDSLYLYASQVYLWNDALPSYTVFNPRQYSGITPELSAYQKELFDITQMKNNPATASPYELPVTAGNPKYSHLQSGTASVGTAAGATAAVGSTSQNAVLQTTVINPGNNNIGYIALGSFPELSSSKTALDNAFAILAAAKPTQLVIDLRTNSGGYVETAEYVANLVAGSSLDGKAIYTEQYNTLLQSGKATILKNQPYLDEAGKPVIYNGRNATMADVDYTEAGNTYYFSKKGTLETITDIYFIVSSRTASASEMLISCLKPYYRVQLAGTVTYGKPVGFFPVQIDQYSVYLSSFLIKNARGWSDYFTGMPVDIAVTGQSNPVLGDPEETCLKAVLAAINGTNAGTSALKKLEKREKAINSTASSGAILYPHDMVETRLRIKR